MHFHFSNEIDFLCVCVCFISRIINWIWIGYISFTTTWQPNASRRRQHAPSSRSRWKRNVKHRNKSKTELRMTTVTCSHSNAALSGFRSHPRFPLIAKRNVIIIGGRQCCCCFRYRRRCHRQHSVRSIKKRIGIPLKLGGKPTHVCQSGFCFIILVFSLISGQNCLS